MTLKDQDFNSNIVDFEECLIDPLESYDFYYDGSLPFEYVQLSCDGCEFQGPGSSNYEDDCIVLTSVFNCSGCEDCDCGSGSDCITSISEWSFLSEVRLNSTQVTLKFYGEVHRVESTGTEIDKYEWEKELNLTVPNITQIQEISSDRYKAYNEQGFLECTNFDYVWYVNDIEEQRSSNDEFFYPQAPDCEETEIKVEIEQSFVGGSSRSGESQTLKTQPEESCCMADQSVPTVSSSIFTLGCDGTEVNLNNIHNGQTPIQSVLIWSTDNGSDILANEIGPVVSAPGEYYGYYYDDNPGCFSEGVKVTVEDFTNPPTFTDYQLYFDCPVFEIDLNDLLEENIPGGIEVRYSTDWSPTGGPAGGVSNSVEQVVWTEDDLPNGPYYWAYYYNPAIDCWSPPSPRLLQLNGSFQGFSYDIDSDDTWDNRNEEIYQLLIREEVTLTIKNSTLMMHPDTRILIDEGAKLILDNVILDNNFMAECGENVKWKGILLYEKGVLVMKNSSIRKAETGVAFNTSKPVQSILKMTSSKIEDCDIGVFLTQDGGKETLIEDSEFINNRRGIYSRNHDNLVVKGSKFNNHQDAGIVLTNSKATIKGGNTFNGGFSGITIDATQPMSSDVVIGEMEEEKNVFTNVDFGILVNGAFGQLASVYAENNEISVPNYPLFQPRAAFMAWGENSYEVKNNVVNSGILWSYMTGSDNNRISCNDIESSIQYFGTNSNSDFLENDIMGSTPVRMNLDLFGTPTRIVRKNIGMNNEAAGNCFEGSNRAILNFGSSFNYYYYINKPCEEPDDPNSSIIKFETDDPGNRCDGRGLYNLIDPDADGTVGLDSFNTTNHITESAVLDSINHWIQTVINLGGDDIRTMQVEGYSPISPQLDQANEILNQWLNYALYRSEHEESTFADQIFQLTGSYDWQTREFGYRVNQGDLLTADTILQSLPTADSNKQVFYNTQVLNLKRLEIEDSLASQSYNVFSEDSLRVLYFDADSAMAHGRPYFTETEVVSIESMGESLTPSAAYARTLYYQLTGNHIDIPPVESGDNSPGLLSGEGDEIRKGKNIYPNPFSEEITISMDEPISSISIFGLNGELVKEVQTNNAKVTLQTNELLPGMYFLQIQTTAGQTTRKMIKQ